MIGFHPCPRPPRTLYQSGWNPKGANRSWERLSMTLHSTRQLLRHAVVPGGAMTEAVGWFDGAGVLRILVCDFDSGKRLTVRRSSRGSTFAIERRPARAPRRARRAIPPIIPAASGAPA